MKAKTHLAQLPTPYELYMKVLIDTFGSQVEDDFTICLLYTSDILAKLEDTSLRLLIIAYSHDFVEEVKNAGYDEQTERCV